MLVRPMAAAEKAQKSPPGMPSLRLSRAPCRVALATRKSGYTRPSSAIWVLNCSKEPKKALPSVFSSLDRQAQKQYRPAQKAETYDGTTYARHPTGTTLRHAFASSATRASYKGQPTRNAIYKRGYEKTRYTKQPSDFPNAGQKSSLELRALRDRRTLVVSPSILTRRSAHHSITLER